MHKGTSIAYSLVLEPTLSRLSTALQVISEIHDSIHSARAIFQAVQR